MARTDRPVRDPSLEKARDNARQRKIAADSSDKAARRHARTIKAMANRQIRRADKQSLTAEAEESADQINLSHQRKNRHWGSENSAERRVHSAKAQAEMVAAGGRKELERQKWQEMRDRTDNQRLLKLIKEQLERLAVRK